MKPSSSLRDLLIASGLYVTSSIVGPLVIFGGTGLALDSVFQTGPWLLLAGVFIAFLATNIILFKKIMKLSKDIEEMGKTAKNVPEKDDESDN